VAAPHAKPVGSADYIAALEKIILDEGCGRRCCVCETVYSIDDSVEANTGRDTFAFCLTHAPVWATV